MRDGYGGTSQDAAARIRLQREAERRRIHELKNRFPYAGTSEGLHQQEEDYEEEEYGEYEEEPSEPEEEEEREPPKPTREEQEFLKLREKLKDRIRQKLKKQSASALGHSSQSQDKKRTTSNDKFGSFFGPSQPIIAPRVIEESRLIRENKHIVAKVSSSGNKRDPTSSEVRTHVHHQKARVVNEVKKKAQALKDMRDYSFLLSDDADLPSEKEQPLTRNVSAPKADGRSAQTPLKSRIPTSKPVKPTLNGHELKKPTSAIRPMQTKVSSVKEAPVNRSKSASVEPRKMLGGGAGNGPVQTTGNKALPSKVPAQITSMNKPAGKAISDPGLKKNPSSAKPHSSAQHYHPDQKRVTQVPHRVKTTPKQPLPSSKAQPSKQIPSRDIHDDRSKKRPVRRHLDEEEDDVDDVRGLIRKMFRYDPSKYAGQDEDVSDMEVGFDVIQKEELRSSQIARREDEEQLRLIEQEEEEERRRKLMGKKQRLRH
ncbi:histone H3.v1-like [Phoenix dactylifera]|uniref:Histone H3.v1-like n=1 Tax=Phoenix dactylifera TaxID=42345 RepID=A0A8B8ZZV7_PHODC|nr:histone H3.v1-like [Phoenix dactylifera]XP_038976784.1 histone H3.v1-like [Phoenix dactylifera]XP_038976785.1 histone H3.v1-like [Phoenix dactylifera]